MSGLSIAFHGAAGTVTGSCFLVRHERGCFLVDCGLFQGAKTVRELNWRPFPFEPREPAALLLTHAHIDHSGLIPRLVKDGFRGRVLCTPGTADLLGYMLPDSGFIQENEVERLNRRNHQRGRAGVEPIYTRADAEACLERLKPVRYGTWVEVMPGVRARFWDAGHILGSASIEVEVQDRDAPTRLLFSGDLGPGDTPFHDGPDGPERPDWLIVESTYGDRDRVPVDAEQRRAQLAGVVRDAMARGGVLLIPSFAVERSQELLYDLDLLMDAGTIPALPVFLDSPLAVRITGVFEKHLPAVNMPGTPHPFRRANLHCVVEAEESKRLNRITGGAIIMAASGMCEAGRIRHHLKNHLWRRNATVLFVGYQAPGTLGRVIQDGARHVRIHGEEVAVSAAIRTLEAYSGHADRSGLLAWIKGRQPVGRGVILVHGEEDARASLREGLAAAGLEHARILRPALDEVIALPPQGEAGHSLPHPRLPGGKAPASDWHNQYAETVLQLGERLRDEPDEAKRTALLHHIRTVLGLPG